MKHKRIYHPQPPEEERFPACPACGSGNVTALDNWMVTPCLRTIRCRACGRRVMGEGESIAACKADALRKWQDGDRDPPPWDDDRTVTGLLEEEET